MQRLILFLLVSMVITHSSHAQKNWPHGRIEVSAHGHYLQYADGTPFFWMGDTAWELFHRLTLDEIRTYLDNRKEKGFNVIQAVVLAEMDGLRKPNQYGEVPLYNMDPTKPNEKYFQVIDSAMKMALTRKIVVALLPTWGDKVSLMWGVGPVIFNPENAYIYGKWIGHRYKDFPNLIWILGGDRPPVNDSTDWRPVWRAMAIGIREGVGQKVLIAYHISGGPESTSQFLQQEKWLDINMMQSGHGSGHDVAVWQWIARDRNLKPTKPTLDAEPNYEDHPVNPWPAWNPANGYFDDYDVRKQTYRSVFAGACGVTYGHHSIWQFWNPKETKINHAKMYWTDALDRPGAFQMGYLKNLMESRPQSTRIPDDSVILKGQGEKGEHMVATRDSLGSYLFVYLPIGKTITINTSFMETDQVSCWWFNPKDGKAQSIGLLPRKDKMEFISPSAGIKNDWVLVIDDPDKHYSIPGQTASGD